MSFAVLRLQAVCADAKHIRRKVFPNASSERCTPFQRLFRCRAGKNRHDRNNQEVAEGGCEGKVMPRRGSATLAHGVSRGGRYTRKRQATEWRQKNS